MSKETKPVKKQKRSPEVRKRRRKRAVIGSFGVTAIIILIFSAFIFFYGSRLLSNFIVKTVSFQSDGLYQVEIGRINVNFLELGFEVEDFHLIPNTDIYREKKSKNEVRTGLYEIRVPHFKITGLRLSAAFYDNSFLIKNMVIDEPNLKLLDVPFFKTDQDYKEGYDDIKPIIVKLVEFFKVRDLRINKGVFDIFLEKEGREQTFTASRISLRLKNFQIDKRTNSGNEKFLYSEGAELVFKDYKLFLNDGIHVIEANEIGINTTDSIVYARGFSLSPSQMSAEDLKKSKSSYFSAFLPEIKMKGSDIIKAYERDSLEIRNLEILRPKINYFNQTLLTERVRSEKTLRSQLDVFPLIKGYLKEVKIAEINLIRGNFKYDEPLVQVPENIIIKGIDVLLNDFQIDSLAFQLSNRILYSKDIQLDFKSFQMSLRDSIHILEAKSLYISSKEKILRAKDLQIHPSKEFNTGRKKDLLNIQLPEITLSGLDLSGMYLNGDLHASQLDVIEPSVDIYIKKVGNKNKKGDRKSKGDIYNLFSKYLRSAKFDRIQLLDGSINFKQANVVKTEEIIADNISLNLYKFNLDSTRLLDEGQFLFSENIDFELKDYDFLLPNQINEIKVGTFRFSSREKMLKLSNISMKVLEDVDIKSLLKNQEKSGYLEFDIPEVNFKKIDVLKVLNERRIFVEHISVNYPVLRRYKYSDLEADSDLPPTTLKIKNLITKIFPDIQVDTVDLNNGQIINFIVSEDSTEIRFQNEAQLRVLNLALDTDSISSQKGRLFFSKNLRAIFVNQNLFFNDEVHFIHSDSVILKYPEKTLELVDFELIPNYKNLKNYDKQVYIKAHASKAKFENVDLSKFYNEQILNVKEGYFDTIFLEIYQSPFYKKSNKSDSLAFDMPNLVSELNLDKLKIEYGVFKYYDKYNNLIAQGDLFGEVIKSTLNDSTIGNDPLLTPVQDVNFNFPKIEINLNDNLHRLVIKDLKFDFLRKQISSKRVSLIMDSTIMSNSVLTRSSYYDFVLDSFEIDGFNFKTFYLDKDIKMKRMSIWQPRYNSFRTDTITSGRPDLSNIDLFKYLKPYANLLNIDLLQFENGQVRQYYVEEDQRKLRLSLDKVFIDITQLKIDSSKYQNESILNYSKNVNFRVKDFSRVLPGDLMRIEFDELGLVTGSPTLYAKGVYLMPLYDEYEYSRKVGYQSDRVELKIKDLELRNINLTKLYEDNFVQSGELFIDSFFIDDFRDKRVEFNQDLRPPMLHEIIRNAPIKFSLDSIHANNGYAAYRELAEDGQIPGKIYFNDINAKIYNISNDTSNHNSSPLTYMYALGRLMDEGDLIMNGNFNFLDTNNTFNIRGSLGEMDMTAVNPILENVAFVSIKSGTLKKFSFNFEADDNYAKGKLSFGYFKFKIFLINKKTGEPEGLTEGLASWFANTFLINTRNPHLGRFKQGDVFYRRDKRKSIVNYVWKSIFSGIKTSIGAQTQKKLHKIADKEEKALSKE